MQACEVAYKWMKPKDLLTYSDASIPNTKDVKPLLLDFLVLVAMNIPCTSPELPTVEAKG